MPSIQLNKENKNIKQSNTRTFRKVITVQVLEVSIKTLNYLSKGTYKYMTQIKAKYKFTY